MQSTRTILQTESEQKPLEEQDDLGRKFVLNIDGHLYELYPDLEAIPNEWWLTLWEMYEASLNIEDAIQEQRVYTLQQFFEAMIDRHYMKSLVLQDGRPMGLMLGTTDLEKMRVNGINPDALRRRFPEATARNRLFYLMVIYFSPELRSLGFLDWYISLVLWKIESLCDVYISDVPDSRYFLINFVGSHAKEAGLPVGPAEIVGTQSYYALIRQSP